MTEPSEVVQFSEELRDRFGPLPEPAKILVDKIMLKVMCKGLGIERLDLNDQRLVLSFAKDCRVKPERITDMIEKAPRRFRLAPDSTLEVSMSPDRTVEPLKAAKKVLQDLA
jgi:transcription-repair coupling factor (superfamily II helicase)